MPRFRNTLTGVVVSVDDATAPRLGAAYKRLGDEAPEKSPAPTKKSPRRRTAKNQH